MVLLLSENAGVSPPDPSQVFSLELCKEKYVPDFWETLSGSEAVRKLPFG